MTDPISVEEGQRAASQHQPARTSAATSGLLTEPSSAIAFRAGAMCIAREPHRAPGEDWPCAACRAVASTLSTGAARLPAEGVDGAAGHARTVPHPERSAAPTPEHNRVRDATPDPADRATAIARNESMP